MVDMDFEAVVGIVADRVDNTGFDIVAGTLMHSYFDHFENQKFVAPKKEKAELVDSTDSLFFSFFEKHVVDSSKIPPPIN